MSTNQTHSADESRISELLATMMNIAAYDEETKTYYVEFDDDEDVSVVVTSLTMAISGKTVDAVTPLDEIVDPDALNQLFAPKQNGRRRVGGKVSFEIESYRVVIDHTNRLTIREEPR